jgi:hypothetical protein
MGQPLIIMLAHRGDAGSSALATCLRHRGAQVVRLDEHTLVRAVVRHHPDSGPVPPDGSRSPLRDAVSVHRGIVVDRAADVVLCRLPTFASPRRGSTADGGYATQEVFALALSWLHGLGEAVVNPPSPRSLAGAVPQPLTVATLAAGVGLRPARMRLWSNGGDAPTGPDGRVRLPVPREWVEPVGAVTAALVCGDVVVGAPPGLASATIDLVHAAGLDVGEVRFGVPTASDAAIAEDRAGDDRTYLPRSSVDRHGGAGPVVIGVDPVPSLRADDHVEALATHLLARADLRRRVRRRAPTPAHRSHRRQGVPA